MGGRSQSQGTGYRVPESLDDVLAQALAYLAHGASDPGSRWRRLSLATTGTDLRPQARTVVLRAFDTRQRLLDVHTDARSAKAAELRRAPFASLHGWDEALRVQLRASGPVSLHVQDEVAGDSWARLRPESRATYGVMPGPGTVIADPDAIAASGDTAAYRVFCVIRLRIEVLEWLHLAQSSHRRARFCWHGSNLTTMWLVP